FGYDPLRVYTGRAPLEAAAMGIALGPDDWAVRCNLVTVENEEMRDFTAGHISSEEGRPLIEAMQSACGNTRGSVRIGFHAGVQYRNLLVCRPALDKGASGVPFDMTTRTQPPHDIPDRPIADYLPSGRGSESLRELMDRSREVFRDHPVNQARRAKGK